MYVYSFVVYNGIVFEDEDVAGEFFSAVDRSVTQKILGIEKVTALVIYQVDDKKLSKVELSLLQHIITEEILRAYKYTLNPKNVPFASESVLITFKALTGRTIRHLENPLLSEVLRIYEKELYNELTITKKDIEIMKTGKFDDFFHRQEVLIDKTIKIATEKLKKEQIKSS